MFTEFESKPPPPITEEVIGGNLTTSYSASLWSGWDLGQMAMVRKYRAVMKEWRSGTVSPPPKSAPLILRLTAGV